MKQHYVVGFVYDSRPLVVLVKKKRPAWQEELLNGVGGKVEEGESPQEAMSREFTEETGLRLYGEWEKFLVLYHHDAIVHYFRMPVTSFILDKATTKTDEEIVLAIPDLLKREEMVPDLCWVMPLALYGGLTLEPITGVMSL